MVTIVIDRVEKSNAMNRAMWAALGAAAGGLSADDGEHSASDEVSVTALPANLAPTVTAGADRTYFFELK